MWSIDFLPDPLAAHQRPHPRTTKGAAASLLLSASIVLEEWFIGSSASSSKNQQYLSALREGGRGARVALADFCARHFLTRQFDGRNNFQKDDTRIQLDTLDKALFQCRRWRKNGNNGPREYPPYVVERSDFWCGGDGDKLHVMLRMLVFDDSQCSPSVEGYAEANCKLPCQGILSRAFPTDDPSFVEQLLCHVACVVLQQRLRDQLVASEAIAFLSDGAILPRNSGTSHAPMASPPAVPFQAPKDSPMSQSISVKVGATLAQYLPADAVGLTIDNATVTLSGLVVPGGITLICGGGYHGKSTTLQAISMGVYDKIPGDGRELCVSVTSAVTVRAEDGRYVNNCNISAFISNLPTPPGVEKALDTQHFSSRDASGSTSQAANVVEAIEMGATAMLVDEDISAANFMARDGRMRALVMDESITPLLYRVNGLYNTHKISSVVVVGGVGDWLDVPHNVILLDKYMAYDATKKAQSISYQFSYGHVQYAGRGVVHRLEWDKKGTPVPRRPVDCFCRQFDSDVVISILDGGHALSLHKDDDNDEDAIHMIDDDDEGCVDASRIEQLLNRRQLFGTGVCVAWLLQHSPKNPRLGLQALLQNLDSELDKGGFKKIVSDLQETTNDSLLSKSWLHLLESVGFIERPRGFEIGQVLTRLNGIQMEEIPVEDDGSDEAARLEEERRNKALANLWASRRSNQAQ